MTLTAPCRRDFRDGFDIPLRRDSYPTIRTLIDQGTLQPLARPAREADDAVKGVGAAQTYQLAPGTDLQVPDSRTLQIGGEPVQADVYRLPSHAYTALQQQKVFRSFACLDDILTLARAPGVDVRDVRVALERIALSGLWPDQPLSLVTPNLPLTAEWLSAGTLIHRTPTGDYFATLTFRTTVQRPASTAPRVRIAVDLGLDPITTALTADGDSRVFRPTPLTLPDRAALTPGAQLVYDQVVYGSGRLDAERVTRYLLTHASEVVSEKLRLQGMERGYVLLARDRALHDHHYAALPQALNASRIPLRRVPSGYTSQECPKEACRHVSRENRRGPWFHCQRCGYTADAHLVACLNLLRRAERAARRSPRCGPSTIRC